jgi:hypothetical protein
MSRRLVLGFTDAPNLAFACPPSTGRAAVTGSGTNEAAAACCDRERHARMWVLYI